VPLNKGFLVDTNIFREVIGGNQVVLGHWGATGLPVFLSSVAVEEVLGGFMANLNRARSGKFPISVSEAHDDLISTLEAEVVFQSFAKSVTRIGTQDCRIAAQAIAHQLTVVTRNLQDFQRIGAPCVDWTVE
jgi:tRNA(fMet)-specific endonuclease VapC